MRDGYCPLRGRSRGRVALICVLVLSWQSADAAEKVRSYPCGEADDDGEVGEIVLETLDVTSPPTEDAAGSPVFDGQGEFVSLVAESEPIYTEGRDEDGVAIQFDGIDDQLTSGPFDPRNFGSFAALSQAWVKPDGAGSGTQQAIWSLGNDNGGAGISADGRWELIAVSLVPDTVSDVEVEFDTWTHVAVLRTGNTGRLFINGELATSGDHWWNGVGLVTVGNRSSGGGFFSGAIDDFSISGFSDGSFNSFVDIDFFEGESSDVFGDINQDRLVDEADYAIWSENSGFDNGLGAGDGSTMLRGDVDQNGRVNFFDFWLIQNEVNDPVEVEIGPDGLIVAEDFLYNQPDKVLGPGGGFTLQDYGGGQGAWSARWGSIGNGIITGIDFEPPEHRLAGLTTTGLSANSLDRDFDLGGVSEDQPIFFGVRFMTLEGQEPIGRLVLNSREDELFEISIGIDPAFGFMAVLGVIAEFPFDLVEITPGEFHQLVGKLDVNSNGDLELLSVWLDPDDEESAEFEVFLEADVVTDVDALLGDLRLDRGTSGSGAIIWDDLAVGTTWNAVTNVGIDRIEVQVDQASGGVSLVNSSGSDIELHYYEIVSASGSLDPAGWTALGDEPFSRWEKNNPTSNALTESFFQGSVTFAAGGSIDLGPIFVVGGTQDLVARVGSPSGLLHLCVGDRDEDGVVDPQDNCVLVANGDQTDADSDGLGDACDNCPQVSNRDQVDLDEDGVGNLCDDEIADTFRDWSTEGAQGENNMFYGYFDVTDDLSFGGTGEYEPDKFTEFLNDGSMVVTNDALNWRDGLNHWNGSAWDLTTGAAPPWTSLGRLDLHPSDPDPESEHHVVRRWVADRDASVTVLWHVHHQNVACGGNGVGAQLYHDDTLVDEAAVDGPDDVGVTRSVELTIREGETIDLLLSPIGPDGNNDDGCDGSRTWFLVSEVEGGGFNRGDADADGTPVPVTLTDAVFVLNFLFTGGRSPTCLDAADADDNGSLEISDAIVTLNFLFLGGNAPPSPDPFSPCGTDPTEDDLDCASYENCG